ncbi:hypothetical protein [Aliarcobacter butzleri]|nr:hypothetical protein [Aliarcobacter butzleri]
MSEEIKETIKRSYNLKNLYLEQNNYRFIDIDDNVHCQNIIKLF